MKLFYSPTSPYVRKVMATAMAVGADALITKVTTNPHESPADLITANPLSKVPCLVTDDGVALFDSPVICEFIDAAHSGVLFPSGAARWRALKFQAIGDGIMDAAVARRGEQGKPEEAARTAAMERYRHAVARSLDLLESEVPADHLDIGTITVACALGYLDLRFAAEPWRNGHPKLTAWYDKMSARPELKNTAPPT
jgi:glutathione S-transferase